MTEETPSVEEIKERLKVEIPVVEEVSKDEAQKVDISAELQDLGRQFADTLRTAWHSEERQRLEGQFREGVQSFAEEIDKVIHEVRGSKPAERVSQQAVNVKDKVETTEVGRKARTSFAQGLHWLSEELGKLADQFTPPNKSEETSIDDAAAIPAAEDATTEDA